MHFHINLPTRYAPVLAALASRKRSLSRIRTSSQIERGTRSASPPSPARTRTRPAKTPAPRLATGMPTAEPKKKTFADKVASRAAGTRRALGSFVDAHLGGLSSRHSSNQPPKESAKTEADPPKTADPSTVAAPVSPRSGGKLPRFPTAPSLKMRKFRRADKSESKKAAAQDVAVLDASEPILDSLSKIWARDLDDLPVAKDLPRLARRIAVYGRGDQQLFKIEEENFSAQFSIDAVKDLLLALCSRLNPDTDEVERVRVELEKISSESNSNSEEEEFCHRMLAIVQKSSKPVIATVKAIHQDVVLHATVELKTHLTAKYLTKDVRSAEGWRIVVRLPTEGVVHIYHVKREQSLDVGGDKTNHYEFEWELRMTFDGKMKEMHSAQIRVLNLFLAESMDAKLEKDLRKHLVGDMLVM